VAARQYNSTHRQKSSMQTRTTVLDSAAELFARNGYAKTTVPEIARLAGVATNTVYSSVGGKVEVFLALLERGTGAQVIDETLARIEATVDAAEVLALTAYAYRRSFESAREVISVLDEAGRHDPAIAQANDDAQSLYRSRLDRIAAHLRTIGALAPSVDERTASDVLWFYFGFGTWPQLRGVGWNPEQIENWLAARAQDALLGPVLGRT
jgi:AcrR family transcriptional regulator